MDGWRIVVLSGIVSLVTAILSTVITTGLTRKSEIRMHILEERTKFYFEIFPIIDTLINYPENIYNEDYWDEFMSFKAKMKLLASKKTFKEYERLFIFMTDSVNALDIYDGIKCEENPSTFCQEALAKIDQSDFKLARDEFVNKYLPDRDITQRYVENLYKAMRIDLGSNLK